MSSSSLKKEPQAQRFLPDFGSFRVAISAIIVLKLVSAWIRHMSLTAGSVIVFLLLLGAIAGGTEATIFILYYFGFIPERWPDWHMLLLIRSLLIGAVSSILG